MIGKVMTGKSFRGCINYCLEDKKQKEGNNIAHINWAEVLHFNQCYGNKKELIGQFNETRQLNSKLSKPVLHITLSFAPGEKLTKGQLVNIIQDCAKHFGFQDNQFIGISHNDTGHQHLHIIANRIGFDIKTVSDSNSYKKMADFCREMEMKYSLQQVLSPKKFLTKELRQIPRTDTRKEAIKKDIENALLLSKTYADFEDKMKQKNYQVLKGRGIAFIDEKGVYVKGSSLGYSLATIEKILQQSQGQKQTSISWQEQRDSYLRSQFHSHKLYPAKKLLKEIKTVANKNLDILLNPSITNENVPHQLLEKKKKRRKHLSI